MSCQRLAVFNFNIFWVTLRLWKVCRTLTWVACAGGGIRSLGVWKILRKCCYKNICFYFIYLQKTVWCKDISVKVLQVNPGMRSSDIQGEDVKVYPKNPATFLTWRYNTDQLQISSFRLPSCMSLCVARGSYQQKSVVNTVLHAVYFTFSKTVCAFISIVQELTKKN